MGIIFETVGLMRSVSLHTRNINRCYSTDKKAGAFLVTGGGSGLGEAAARSLSKEYNVIVCDLKEGANDYGAVFCETDVTNPEQVSKAVEMATSKFGGVRGAISCAGIGHAQKVLSKKGVHSLEAFNKVINVNLTGTFNVVRLCAEQMEKQQPYNKDGERGVFINTASVAAFDGQIGQIAYSASKGGIVAMMLPLAREFHSLGIRVCTIAPGIFNTPLMQALPEKAKISLGAAVPFPKRMGDPAEFGSMCSEIVRNTYLNGEVIRVDGALRMI